MMRCIAHRSTAVNIVVCCFSNTYVDWARWRGQTAYYTADSVIGTTCSAESASPRSRRVPYKLTRNNAVWFFYLDKILRLRQTNVKGRQEVTNHTSYSYIYLYILLGDIIKCTRPPNDFHEAERASQRCISFNIFCLEGELATIHYMITFRSFGVYDILLT